MARTVAVIKKTMTDAIAADVVLSPVLNSSSSASIYGLFIFIVAYCAWGIESLMDLFKADVNYIIAQENTHTPQWYVNKAKQFQYGYNLVPQRDYYDNSLLTPDEIAASQIVAYAAFVELPVLRLKLAQISGTGLGKLSDAQMAPIIEYVMRFKDAGVKLLRTTNTVPTNITSTDPDNLLMSLRVKFNPLVLNMYGNRVDGTASTPVADAARNYLSNLEFNGLFSVQKIVDAIQAVAGVNDLHVDNIQTQYGALPFTNVDIDFIPDAGYLVIADANFNIQYIAS